MEPNEVGNVKFKLEEGSHSLLNPSTEKSQTSLSQILCDKLVS